MRRILMISDTHGNLDIINEKVAQTNADMVIHAGDFVDFMMMRVSIV